MRRLLDAVSTVAFGLIGVCSFYGIWSAEEVYFLQHRGESERAKNALECVVIKSTIVSEYFFFINICLDIFRCVKIVHC